MSKEIPKPAATSVSWQRHAPPLAAPLDSTLLFQQSGLDFAAYGELVTLVYAGAGETVPWTRLLDALRELLQANYVTLILRLPQDGQPLRVVFSGEAKPAIAARFTHDLSAVDPYVNLPRGRMVSIDELISEEAWTREAYYHHFTAPLDVHFLMAAEVGDGSEADLRLRVTRASDANPFGEREKAICNLLLPHLAQALQLRSSLDAEEVERDAYIELLDQLSIGLIFLDNEGCILKTNQTADKLLAQDDGLSAPKGYLSASFPGEGKELRTLIEQALSTGEHSRPDVLPGMSLTRPSGLPNLEVVVRLAPPTRWSESHSRPTALVLIRDPEARVLASGEQLRRLYQFTPAEARLAIQLMDGCNIDEAAERLNISRNTVRSQIRAIFAKTSVNSQAELLRVLLSGAAPLG